MFFPSRRGTGMMLTSTSRRALGSTAKDGSLRRPRETHYLASREPGGGRKSRACDRRRRSSMTEIPTWHITGDWFDNCSCAVACPCTFAQAPDNGFCESVLFWHILHGRYGDIPLDDLSLSGWGGGRAICGRERPRAPPAALSTSAPTTARLRFFPGFSAARSEDFRLSSPGCLPKAGKFGVSSARISPSRSRPTARIGEPRSRVR